MWQRDRNVISATPRSPTQSSRKLLSRPARRPRLRATALIAAMVQNNHYQSDGGHDNRATTTKTSTDVIAFNLSRHWPSCGAVPTLSAAGSTAIVGGTSPARGRFRQPAPFLKWMFVASTRRGLRDYASAYISPPYGRQHYPLSAMAAAMAAALSRRQKARGRSSSSGSYLCVCHMRPELMAELMARPAEKTGGR